MTEDLKLHIKRWEWGSKPSKYQVGPILFFKEIQLDNYFLMKLYRTYISEDSFENFCNYHLDHYKTSVKEADDFSHFKLIWEIIEAGIAIQNRYPFSELAKKRKRKLLAFRKFLKSMDQWNHSYTIVELVSLKNREIESLNQKLAVFKKDLSRLKVDCKGYVNLTLSEFWFVFKVIHFFFLINFQMLFWSIDRFGQGRLRYEAVHIPLTGSDNWPIFAFAI